MSLNKYKLEYDPTETDSENDVLGAYLKSASGVEITHTQNGAKESLDVHLAGSDLVDFDIRDLNANQDNVAISDGTDTLAIEADGSINVNTTQQALNTCAYGAVSVTNVATDLIGTDLSGRKAVLVQNRGNKSVFIGCDNLVTDSTGIEIPAGGSLEFPYGDSIDIHAITTSGTADIRYVELAA